MTPARPVIPPLVASQSAHRCRSRTLLFRTAIVRRSGGTRQPHGRYEGTEFVLSVEAGLVPRFFPLIERWSLPPKRKGSLASGEEG